MPRRYLVLKTDLRLTLAEAEAEFERRRRQRFKEEQLELVKSFEIGVMSPQTLDDAVYKATAYGVCEGSYLVKRAQEVRENFEAQVVWYRSERAQRLQSIKRRDSPCKDEPETDIFGHQHKPMPSVSESHVATEGAIECS